MSADDEILALVHHRDGAASSTSWSRDRMLEVVDQPDSELVSLGWWKELYGRGMVDRQHYVTYERIPALIAVLSTALAKHQERLAEQAKAEAERQSA